MMKLKLLAKLKKPKKPAHSSGLVENAQNIGSTAPKKTFKDRQAVETHRKHIRAYKDSKIIQDYRQEMRKSIMTARNGIVEAEKEKDKDKTQEDERKAIRDKNSSKIDIVKPYGSRVEANPAQIAVPKYTFQEPKSRRRP